MSSVVEEIKHLANNIDLTCKIEKQQYLIKFILTNSQIDLPLLSRLLGVKGHILNHAVVGITPLKGKPALRLVKLYSLFFKN